MLDSRKTDVRPVRVLVADRQPLFREAAARAVRQRAQFHLVGEVGDGQSALRLLRAEAPDVALVDVRLPGIDGRRVLNAAVRDGLTSRILLISSADDGAAGYAALEAGAGGWLSRGSTPTSCARRSPPPRAARSRSGATRTR